jgi:hypothetical protein
MGETVSRLQAHNYSPRGSLGKPRPSTRNQIDAQSVVLKVVYSLVLSGETTTICCNVSRYETLCQLRHILIYTAADE